MTLVEWVGGGGLLSYGAVVVLRASVLLLGALVLALLLRRASAAARHVLWSVTLGALVALPVLPLLLPGVPVPLPAVHVEVPAFARSVASGGLERHGAEAAHPEGMERGASGEHDAFGERTVPMGQNAAGGQSEFGAGRGPVGGGVAIGAISPVGPLANQAIAASAPPAGGPGPAWLPPSGALLLVWLAGASLLGAFLLVGLWRARRLARRASRTPGEAWRRSLERACREVGVRRRVSLVFSSGVRTPMAGGVFRPVVILPRDAWGWSAERREIVLLHELVHVKRADPLRQVLGRVALALYWFHPLAWLSARAATLAREEACDEAVVSLGRRPSIYARHLVALADADTLPVPALSRLDRPPLEKRIMSILRPHVPRRGSTVLAVGALAITWALAVAMVSPDGEPRSASSGEPAPAVVVPTSAHFPVAQVRLPEGEPVLDGPVPAHPEGRSPPDPVPPDPVPPEWFPPEWFSAAGARLSGAAVDPRLGCRPGPDGLNFSDGRDFGAREAAGTRSVWTRGDRFVQWSVDGGMLCIRTHGEVVLAEGGSRIAAIGEGSWVVLAVRARVGGEDRHQRMEIVAGADGPEHAWFVDGQERPFDPGAREWRDAMLEVLGTHLEISRLRGEEARLRGEMARTRGDEARYRGEIARIRGEEARLGGEMARIRGEEARLRGDEARIRGQEARHRGDVVRLRRRMTALEGAARATEDEETRTRLLAEIEEVRARVQEAELDRPSEDAARALVELQARLEAQREAEAPRIAALERRLEAEREDAAIRIREIEEKIAGLNVSDEVRELEGRIQELDAPRRIREMESGMEAALARLQVLIEAAW